AIQPFTCTRLNYYCRCWQETVLLATHNAKCVATKLSNGTGTTLQTLNFTAKLKSEFPQTFRRVALNPKKLITFGSTAVCKLNFCGHFCVAKTTKRRLTNCRAQARSAGAALQPFVMGERKGLPKSDTTFHLHPFKLLLPMLARNRLTGNPQCEVRCYKT